MQAMKGNPKAFEMLLSLSGLMDDSTEAGNPFDGVTTEDLKKLVDNDG